MDIKEVHKELLPVIQEELQLIAVGYSMKEIGDSFEKLSQYFQALAICHLLETADENQFRENLIRSGFARRYFLKKSHEQGNLKDRRLALSRTEAFLDSVAAGHLQLGREIADLSLLNWESNWEYEDDFCIFQFLHYIVKKPDELANHRVEKILSRFEKAIEGTESLRLEVCKGIISREKEKFSTTFNELMKEKQDLIDEERERMLEPCPSTYVFWPRSFVSIEGLALLKIAEIIGIKIDEDFPLCPSIGRLSTTEKEYTDFFQEIDQVRSKG